MATSLDAFLPLVDGRIRGCPDVIEREALRDACIRFCKRTRLLIEDVQVYVAAGERFSFLYPSDGITYIVDSVRRGEQELEHGSRHDFMAENLDVTTGTPHAYYLEGDGQVVLGPIPDADETLVARCTVRPSDSALSVNDALYSDWREAIAAGARVYVRRNYDAWADSQLEAEDRALFEDAVAQANVARARGRSRRPLRARGYYF